MRKLIFCCFLFFSLNSYCQTFDYLPTSNGEIVKHTFYTLSYLEEHEQPEWVAYYLSPDMLKKVYKRKDSFKADPLVSTNSATYADYTSAPDFDAGHLLPCRQMQFDCNSMSETFFMSNMSPQRSSFNRHKWSYLEKLERNMAWRNNGIYVVTGPVLSHISGTIGVANKISIPEYYYKVFLRYSNSESKAIAFLLPNRKENTPFEDYVVSIDSIESLTGIDFFPSLADMLENQLEVFSDKSKWSFSNPNANFGYTSIAQKCSSSNTVIVANNNTKININTASNTVLQSLPGIGASKAQAIINMRPFNNIEDILNVSGIGQSTFNKIKDLITVD